MSTSHQPIAKPAPHEPAKQLYSSPVLTRCGTVEQLTGVPTDLTTASGFVSN